MHHDRHGAKQPVRFDPARAAILDDTARFAYVPPETLVAELAPPRSGTIVDFGAGTGLYTLAIARFRPDLRIFALDEQPRMLEHLRAAITREGASNVQPIDPAGLASLCGIADGVLALNVLHELGDAALADLRALLRPHAPALFADWNAGVDRPVGPPQDHVYDAAEAAQRLEAAGFRVEPLPALAYHYVLRAYRAVD